MKQTKKGLMRFLAVFFAFLLVFTAVPASALITKAAAKPKLKAKVTVKEGKTKGIAITKNGFTIKSVRVESDDEDIVTATANKKKVKVTGEGTGVADITTTIKAAKNGVVNTYTYTTTVTVKAQATTTVPVNTTPTDTTPADTTPTNTTPTNTTPTTTVPVTTTPVSTTATVNTQTELNAALADSNIKTVTIGQSAANMNISAAVYSDKDLIVDAPNASIVNLAQFKSIEIKSISPNTWEERVSGNSFIITATQPVRINAPANYSITSIRFTGTLASGTSNVIIGNGKVDAISVEARHNLNVSATGTATVNKISVNANASVGVNCAENATINTIEAADTGVVLNVGATNRGRINEIKVTHASTGSANSTLNATAASTATISTIDVASTYTTVTVSENDTATVGTLRLRECASANIYGTSRNQIYLDMNNATTNIRVTCYMSYVRAELGYNLVPQNVIKNEGSADINVTYYASNGSRTTTTIAGRNVARTTFTLTVAKTNNSTNQITATFSIAVPGLSLSNFRLSASNGTYITNAVTTDGGRNYILTLNSAIVADQKYTVEVTGLDTNQFTSSTMSAYFSTQSTSMTLNKTTLSATDAQIGSTERLTVQILPNDGLSRVASWYTGDTSVVTVDSNGVVTYKGVGTTTVTAYYGNLTASCKVTVTSTTKSNPYLLVRNAETRNVIDNMIVVGMGKSVNLTFSVEDLGSDSIKNWEVESSFEKVKVTKGSGNSFDVISTVDNDGASSVITLTVTLSSGQTLTKIFYFEADLPGEA